MIKKLIIISIAVLMAFAVTQGMAAIDLDDLDTLPSLKDSKSKYGIDYGGHAEAEFAVDTKRDGPDEDIYDGRNKLFLFLSAKPFNGIKLFLSGKIQLNYSAGRQPREDFPEMDFIERDSRSHLIRMDKTDRGPDDLYQLPYEAYITYSHQYFSIKAGQQIVKWGTNDYLSPTNLINPVDVRGMIDPERDDVVIPILALKGDIYPADFLKLEGIFVPYFVKSEFHLFKTDFAVCKEEVCPVEEDQDIRYREPKKDLEFAEYGFMAHLSVSDFDAEISYLHTREDFPVFLTNFVLSDLFIRAYYPEIDLIGGGMSYLYKDFTIKMEGNYSKEKHVTRHEEDESITTAKGTTPALYDEVSPWYAFAAELDYQHGTRYFASVGYETQVMKDPPPNLVVYSDQVSVILFFGQALFKREKLALKMGFLYFIEDEDSLYAPRLSYSFTDRFSTTLGANIFEGTVTENTISKVSPLGMFQDNDQLFLGLRYTF